MTMMMMNSGSSMRSSCFILLIALCFLASSSVTAYGKAYTAVVELTTDNFQTVLEDPANGLFLLKFYAPWCGHCKKLAPILDEVAPKVAGKMAIGTIDCTTNKPLCNEYNVKAFPTLKFYKDGTFYEYPGGRKPHEIIKFANKMSQPAVETIASYEAALELAKHKSDTSVAFVLYDNTMTGTKLQDRLQSTLLAQVFHQVARKKQALATFVVLEVSSNTNDNDNDAALNPIIPGQTNLPDSFIVKVENNVDPLFWTVDQQYQTSTNLMQFVKERNVPLVSALGPANFHNIGHIGRQLVIGCVDGSDDAQVEAMQAQLQDYAKTGPTAITSQYYFGWMDGKLWSKFLQQFQVNTLPQIFVLHVPTKGYFQNETYGEDSIQALLEAIDTGTIIKKDMSTNRGWKGMTVKAQNMFFTNLPWSLVAVIALVVIIVIIIIPPAEEMRPPYNNRPADAQPDEATQAGTFEEDDDDHDDNHDDNNNDHQDDDQGAGDDNDDDETKKDK